MRCILAFLFISSLPALGWWDEGHQVIARIAVEHLTLAARAQAAELLHVDDNPLALANAMAKAAIWADQTKSDETASWHFLNLTWQDNRSSLAERCPGDDCVTARLRFFAAQLKAEATDEDSKFTDEDALRFVVHFVGDLHQPMHTVSNADRGGNCEQLADFIDQAENIHAVWDGPLVSHMAPDDASLAEELNTEISALSDAERAALSAGDIDDWAWESHRLAMVKVYKRLDIPKEDVAFPKSCTEAPDEIQELRIVIDDNYLNEMQPIVREQLKKAGLRLASILNDVLD